MNRNPVNGRDEPSTDWVKGRLKAMAAVEPLPSLRDTLEAGVPVGAAGTPITRGVWPWSRRARWAGAAAAAVVAVSVFAWLRTPGGLQIRSTFDANSSSGHAYATDHNGLRPSDTNVCDINSLR